MSKYYYKRNYSFTLKKGVRLSSLGFCLLGILILLYISFPLVSWQIYFAPVFAASDVQAPIPKTTIVNSDTLGSLFSGATAGFGKDFTNAQNWFPTAHLENGQSRIPSYQLSIPSLQIEHAIVSTTDYDLDKHLVHYGNTPVPPDKGNAVIFGHSTLPQLFNKSNYKTIFANAYKLKLGDEIVAESEGVTYTYKIYNITVVDPIDTSAFVQDYDVSMLTLVTCTPPGTTWKRLIIKTKLQKI